MRRGRRVGGGPGGTGAQKVLVLSPMPEGLIRLSFAESLEKYELDADFKTIKKQGSVVY